MNSFCLKERLKECGYRFTGQRSAVLDILIENPEKHLSIILTNSLLIGNNEKSNDNIGKNKDGNYEGHSSIKNGRHIWGGINFFRTDELD